MLNLRCSVGNYVISTDNLIPLKEVIDKNTPKERDQRMILLGWTKNLQYNL